MSMFDLYTAFGAFIGEHALPVVQAMACGFVGQFLAAHTLGGHHDRLVERAERWRRGAEPQPGFGSFHGRVISKSSGDEEEQRSPVVERVVRQRRTGQNEWMDIGGSDRADPFTLQLAGGHELEVVPGTPQLSGFEVTEPAHGVVREIWSAVYPGEEVWVTGYLEPPPRGIGAYRGGGSARKLRAPRGKPVLITREAPSAEWRRLARAHRIGGWVALAALAVAAAVGYDAALHPLFVAETAPRMSGTVALVWMCLVAGAPIAWIAQVNAARAAWRRRFLGI